MAEVDPRMVVIPDELLNTFEKRDYFETLERFLHDLWVRTGGGSDLINDFSTKYRNTTRVDFNQSPYTVQTTDGLIETDTTLGDVTVNLHPVSQGVGYVYEIKQVAGNNETLILGDGAEMIDSDSTGLTIDLLEAVSVKNNGTEWWINN